MYESLRQQEAAITAMKTAKIRPGYYDHVGSILRRHPQSQWPELLRSVRLHGNPEWLL